MNQPIPAVNENDVIRIVKRDYSATQFDTVMTILNEYGAEYWQRGVNRVRLAVLKLAGGDIQTLRREIDVAKRDYRDVLAYAEYPEYMKKVSPSSNLTELERKKIILADWMQYQSWLGKE